MTTNTRTIIEQIVRENYGRLLAILIHQFNDIELGEEILQESMLTALESWPEQGTPQNPPAWLLLTAKNRGIDRLRRIENFARKTHDLQLLDEIMRDNVDADADIDNMQIPDERLRLIFTCCHPALDRKVQVALTLKTVCGFNTQQLASAFVCSEATIAQRLVRAKRKIKIAAIPYQVPPPAQLEERLCAVLSVIYFIFNEGYFSSIGNNLISTGLCDEAMHLGAIMLQLMPRETEVMGLAALMLFHHSRRAARTDARGALIELEHQNRNLWERALIEKGEKLLKSALTMRRPGPYQIQAAISALHAQAKTFEVTDWKQIVVLYRRLETLDANPVIKLNLAVALSYAEDSKTGLQYLATLDDFVRLQSYYPYHAAKAAMLVRIGKHADASRSYRTALKHCHNRVEKEYLNSRLEKVGAG